MGRIRSIKPEIVVDEVTANLPHFEWRLFVSLWLMADDYGNLRGSPGVVKGGTMPEASESLAVFRRAIDRLAAPKVELLELYTVRGQSYIHIRGWSKHQKVDKPGKPLCPGPGEADSSASAASNDTREGDASDSRGSRETLGPDWIGSGEGADKEVDQEGEARAAAPRPPPIPGKPTRKQPVIVMPDDFGPSDAHRTFAAENDLDLAREMPRFIDHHSAKGSVFASWPAALSTWLRNAVEFRKRDGARGPGPPRPPSSKPLRGLAAALALDPDEGSPR